MLKLTEKQISITDFMMPAGFPLNPHNKWVRRSDGMPWDKIELIAASVAGYDANNGRPSTPPRMAVGALILKQLLNCSDDELAEQISKNAYLQYFVGLPGYTTEKAFEASLMVDWRKRYNEEFINEINRMMFESGYESDLLGSPEAREALEDAIDTLHKPDKGSSAKPRDYRRRAC